VQIEAGSMAEQAAAGVMERDASRALTPEALAEIAHELRTPLGGIAAMAEMLVRGMPAERRELADALIASVAHLREVASAILDDHRAAAAQPAGADAVASLASPDLAGMLAPVLGAARARAAAAGLSFTARIGESVPAAIAGIDATRLRQMLENLLDNAFKLTSAGEIGLAIDRIERRGDMHVLRFAVRDSGPGFSGEQAAALFERFHRLDETLPGTGIGLSLVRRYARAHGGDAQAEALPGSGAVVWFSIAVRDGAPAPCEAAPARCARPTILVVDDDPAGRMVMAAMLRQFGCEVMAAGSAPEALGLLGERHVDAVTMDMTMQDMNGGEATRAIRATWPARLLPVIAVTGRVSERDQRLFRQAGANGFVPKPVSPRAVWAALREAGVIAPGRPFPLAAA